MIITKVKKITLVALLAVAASLAACKQTIPKSSGNVFSVGEDKCSAKQARMMLMDLQKDYSDVYGINLWEHDFGEDGGAAEYIKAQALTSLENIFLLNSAGEYMGYELSDDEMALASEAAQTYIGGLSDDEKEYLDADADDAEGLYKRCMMAGKVYDEATADVSDEISDDEARVMHLLYMYTTSSSSADEAMRSLESGTEFKAVAAAYSDEGGVAVTADRYTFDDEITDQIFLLSDGDYSDIIYSDGGYYIFYCVENYDEELTRANAADALINKKNAIADDIVAEYGSTVECKLYEISWGELETDDSLETESPSFSEVYKSIISKE